MRQLQTYSPREQVDSRHTVNSRQSAERMLRDIAFVLQMTQRVKREILAGNGVGSADHSKRKAIAERHHGGSAWRFKRGRSVESMN